MQFAHDTVTHTTWRRYCFGSWTAWVQSFPTIINDTTLPARLGSGNPAAATLNDFNLAMDSGWYWITNPNTNGPPPGTHWVVCVNRLNNINCRQIAYAYPTDEIWMRRMTDNNWAPWVQTWPISDANLPPRLSSTSQATPDWNTAVQNGWYYSGDVPNVPVRYYSVVGLVSRTGNGKIEQTTWLPDAQMEFKRFSADGVTWSAWVQTWPITDAALPLRLTTGSYAVPGSDWNNAVQNGFYMGAEGYANAPPMTNYRYCMGWVSAYDSANGHVGQLVIGLFDHEVWFRRQASGNWSAWSKIFPAVVDDTNLPARLQSGTFVSTGASITDCDSAIYSGWYQAPPGTAHAPSGDHYFIEVIAGNGGYLRQFAHFLYSGLTYVRVKGGGAWTAWEQVYPISEASFPLRLSQYNNVVADLNVFQTNGWAVSQQSYTLNGPYGAGAGSAVWGIIRCEVLNVPSNCVQTFLEYASNKTWERRCWANVWGNWVQVGGFGAGDPLKLDKNGVTVAGSTIFSSKQAAGDTQYTFWIDGSGVMRWGPGGATAPDVDFFRLQANYLKTSHHMVVHKSAVVDHGGAGQPLYFGSDASCSLKKGTFNRLECNTGFSSHGVTCQPGQDGAFKGNKYTIDWDGAGSTYMWIDATYIGADCNCFGPSQQADDQAVEIVMGYRQGSEPGDVPLARQRNFRRRRKRPCRVHRPGSARGNSKRSERPSW